MKSRLIYSSVLILHLILFGKCQVNYRLPIEVVPSNYALEITPYFEAENNFAAFSFSGNVKITLKTDVNSINKIVLHSNELSILPDFTIRQVESGDAYEIKLHEYDQRNHQNIFRLNRNLVPKKDYIFNINFIGNLSNDMHGFYKSSYDENGVTKHLAATQFEPYHARRAFPCFDEPHFKATFDLKLNRLSTMKPSIANTRITSTNINGKRTQEIFKTTPIMSTYLLAFIVSDFEMRENEAKTVNVYSRSTALSQTVYSLELAQKGLALLSKTFEIDYFSTPGIEKLSLAAIPDFSAGAMENWGLLTYRETALLYDPDHSSITSQEKVAATIIHEEVHMWFGDLVTCDWWSYSWLNEGFARYFNYFITAQIETAWKLEWKFVTARLQSVFGPDSIDGTKPMTVNAVQPNEIDDTFSTISYDKGASVIRMVAHAMLNDKFMAGLRVYLKKHAFKTATPRDLFNALQEYATFNITTFMEPWTTQPGYPLLTVTVAPNRESFTVTQKRFFINGKNTNDKTRWTIPLSIATAKQNADFSKTEPRTYLPKENELGLNITWNEKFDWIIFNVQQTGYYRVNYDDKTWDFIATALKNGNIHALNRAQIVDDSLNLARSGIISYTRAFDNIQFLKNETHYLPWQSAINNFAFIANRLQSNYTSVFRGYVLENIETAYQNLSFHPKPNEDKLDSFNRISIIQTACLNGHSDCIKNAEEEYNKSLSTTHKIPGDIAGVVYCTVLHQTSEDKEWDTLWKIYLNSNVATEKEMLLSALGCTRKHNLINEYLKKSLTNDIRAQDKTAAITATFRNTENLDIVLDFVLSNHTELTAALRSHTKYVKLLAALVKRFVHSDHLLKFDNFMNANNNLYGNEESLKIARASATQTLRWAEYNVGKILTYITKHAKGGTGNLSSTIYIYSILLVVFTAILNY